LAHTKHHLFDLYFKDKKVARLILEAMKLTTKFEGLKTGVDPPTGQNHQSFTELSDQRPTNW
jgi:hypothetical protein